MRILILSILIVGAVSYSSTAQIAGVNSLNPLSGKWVASIEGGATYTLSDFRTSSIGIYGRLLGEYFFETRNPGIFGVRVSGGFGFLRGRGGVAGFVDNTGTPIDRFKTTIINLGAGINYTWVIDKQIFPYAYLGAAYLFFDPRDKNGDRLPNNLRKGYSRQEPSLEGEMGIRFLLNQDISLNISGTMHYVTIDKLDDFRTGRDNDIFFTFTGGISFYIGGASDTDEDGIPDDNDVCPETPHGVRVDEFGCPVDTDGDGVPDYIDRCPQTRANIIVDEDGCPLDTDNDGVPDYIDQCKNTPSNIPVDKMGCPFDTDDDGVPDYKDKCPDTPAGTEVDKFGCKLESQEKILPEITTMVLSGETLNFATGQSNISSDARYMLDKLVRVLKDNPTTRWRVEGHTDNTGSYQTNKRLSLERAWAVADYLISSGINANRLEVVGMGPDYPISDNSTLQGRKINRRVTVDMIVGDGIKTTRDVTRRRTDYTSSDYNSSIERNVGNMIFTDGNLFCFQVSSWRSRIKAEREVDRLQNIGVQAFIVEVHNISGLVGTWYRVRVGFFNTLQDARNKRSQVIR